MVTEASHTIAVIVPFGTVVTGLLATFTTTGVTAKVSGAARAYTGGGYADWYLPSRDELHMPYLNKAAIGGFAPTNSRGLYWSSSQAGDGVAWYQYFVNGGQDIVGVFSTYRVRPLRSF